MQRLMRRLNWQPIVITGFSLLWLFAWLTPATAQSWSNGYSYRNTITIDHTKVPNTDQTDFPVLISGVYSYLATTSNSGLVQNTNGYDIVFTLDPGGTTKLDHEIDSYDPVTGTATFWVRMT